MFVAIHFLLSLVSTQFAAANDFARTASSEQSFARSAVTCIDVGAGEACSLASEGSAFVQRSIRKKKNSTSSVPWEDHEEANLADHAEPSFVETPAQSSARRAGKAQNNRSGSTGEPGGILDNDLLGDSLSPTEHGHGVKKSVKAAEVAAMGKHGHHHHHSQIALLFFFGVLTFGGVVLAALERCLPGLPYTCALFVMGISVSLVHKLNSPEAWFYWPAWFESVEMWQSIDPHMLFFAFLPPLIFGEAMRLNVALANRCFGQVVILACPGVVIGAVLTAMVAKYMFPYGWDWPIAFVFGSILSATDPVAVVALFNTLGVSPRLTMTISGESLLNDGTAIVLFQLMLKWVTGGSLTFVALGEALCVMVIPAFVVGALVSFFFLLVIDVCAEGKKGSDTIIQVAGTICCSYLAFFLAEHGVSASGVLATVSSGFVIAYYAWPRFASSETVKTVWETIEFIANTVIFFLAGVIFMDAILDRWSMIRGIDFAYLFALYLILTLIRTIMLAVLWIPLNMAGTQLNWKEALVMVHSGLRGAVSLALAIIVDIEPAVSPQMGTRVMFHVGGIAAMTALINATTTGPLLAYLGLSQNSDTKERMIRHCAAHIEKDTNSAFDKEFSQGDDCRFAGASQDLVRKLVPALNSTLTVKQQGRFFGRRASTVAFGATDDAEELVAVRKQIYREVFLRIVEKQYWQALEDGVIPRTNKVARVLMHCTSEAIENSHEYLSDWDAINEELEKPPDLTTRAFASLAECRPFSWSERFRRTCSIEYTSAWRVMVILCFQDAHAHARKEVPIFLCASDSHDKRVQDDVTQESMDMCRRASEALESIDAELVQLVKSEMLARRLLQLQLGMVVHMHEKGILQASEASILEDEMVEAMNKASEERPAAFGVAGNGGSSTSSGAQ